MKKTKTFAFTLAEIMIVLTVIGVLSAILLPVASNSMPDKDILKFKKTHNLLMTAFRDLASNGEWFTPGDFSLKPDGTPAGGWSSDGEQQKYYIHALGDILNQSGTYNYCSISVVWDGAPDIWMNAVGINPTRITSENYSSKWATIMFNMTRNLKPNYYDSYFRLPNGACISHTWPGGMYDSADNRKTLGFIIDLDCEEDGIRPFYYFLRKDGKVITDPRVNWWLQRDIMRKSDECCPKSIELFYWCGTTPNADGTCGDMRGKTEICKDDNIPVCAE